jgi:uncharacterized protein YegL
MGWASFNEDNESRYHNATIIRKREHDAMTSPEKQSPAAGASKLNEFVVPSARPLPVIVLADVSGSMQSDGKIQALNLAVREMIATFQDESDLRAEIHVGVITFGGKSRVHLPFGPARNASWSDLGASGGTPLGEALNLAREMVEDRSVLPSRAYRPTIVLVSDGQPTPPGSEVEPLRELLKSDRGGKAFRMALAIGADADHAVLQAFLANPEARVYQADEATRIRQFFQLVTMSVSARSRSTNPNDTSANLPNGDWDL